jgi:hypothetical protein
LGAARTKIEGGSNVWDTTEIQVQLAKLIYGYQVSQVLRAVADLSDRGPPPKRSAESRRSRAAGERCGRQYGSTHVGDVCQTQSHRSY